MSLSAAHQQQQQAQLDDLQGQVAGLVEQMAQVAQASEEVGAESEAVTAAITRLEETVAARFPTNAQLQTQLDEQQEQMVLMAQVLDEMSQVVNGGRGEGGEAVSSLEATAGAPAQDVA